METSIIILTILQAMGISLGVGTSTIALVNFFHAIKDGVIDPIERGFMGLTYIVLRVAMVVIILTVAGLTALGILAEGSAYVTGYELAQVFLTVVLFANASLMTARLMPSKFGPAIQAASWYSLGLLAALVPLGYTTNFSFAGFFFSFVPFVVFMIILIMAIMNIQKRKAQK